MAADDVKRRAGEIAQFLNNHANRGEVYGLIGAAVAGKGMIPLSMFDKILKEACTKVAKLEQSDGKLFEGEILMKAINNAVSSVLESLPQMHGRGNPGRN